jgi:hypothetical protein
MGTFAGFAGERWISIHLIIVPLPIEVWITLGELKKEGFVRWRIYALHIECAMKGGTKSYENSMEMYQVWEG